MMAPPRKHDDDTRKRVVELYQEGVKIHDITEETGVPGSTVWLILAEAGVGPNRLPSVARRAGEGAVGLSFLMERLLELNADKTRLEGQNEALQAENAALRKKLAEARAKSRGGSQN